MPKRAQYTIYWSAEQDCYLFKEAQELAARPSLFVEESLKAWLEEHSAFAFYGRNGQINLLKERRSRGTEGYWYAYRRAKKHVSKRYVGRSSQLSIERLEEIATLLVNEHSPSSSSGQVTFVSQIDGSSAKTHALQAAAHQVSSGKGPVEDIIHAKANTTRAESAPTASASLPRLPLLLSKLQLPHLPPGLLARTHLLELLDKAPTYKVTLISGTAGSGKTTLVASWVAARHTRAHFPPVAYITLDEGDNDQLLFWHYIITACQSFDPKLGKEALAALYAHRPPTLKPLEMMLVTLLNALSQLEQPAILILDDLHTINSSQVAQTLSFFLEHLPPSLHLILLARGEPPFSLVRLQAHNEILDISPLNLRFSLAETKAFFTKELPFSLAPGLVQRIYERLEGWPTGLRLFAEALHWFGPAQNIEEMLTAFSGNYLNIQQYFLHEILHTLPAALQEFLLYTSNLPLITASLCDTITGRTDSAQHIAALYRGDLFLIPLDGSGKWARYYPLFAEAIAQEAHHLLGEACLDELAERASLWYEEHELFAEAIETALKAKAFPRAARLIAKFIDSGQQASILAAPEIYRLKRWLEALPDKILAHQPELCMHAALTLLLTLLEQARLLEGKERLLYLLQMAEQYWRDTNQITKLARIFAFQALLARIEGNILQAMTWARQALSWMPAEEQMWRALALTSLGIGEMLDGSLTNARGLLRETLALNERQGNPISTRATRSRLAIVSFEQGELRLANEQLHQLLAQARAQQDRDDIARTQLQLGRIAYYWNDLNAAEQAIQEALAYGKEINIEEVLALAAVQQARIIHARGHSAQAQQHLTIWLAQHQTAITPQSQQLSREVQAQLASIQLANGDLAAVERWLASLKGGEDFLPLYQRRREQLLQARLLLRRGDITTALEQLEDLSAGAQKTGHVHFKLEIQVVLVLAYSQQGLAEEARQQLVELLQLTHFEGYLRLFLDEGQTLAGLLHNLLPYLRKEDLLAAARRILGAFAQESSPVSHRPISSTPHIGEPLSPQEQRVLRLLSMGNSNAEIASELVVSVNTIRTQLQSIYRKLNVKNRSQASTIARQLDLL
ncbi:hypothetical protein EPA93_00590 [Ktedonosporobacter rubrisoli]|uniref:HTH luxR-type domain-containing protein n=1 Tax=Ktedonosporobacter rubrisoli TaxID=2509675 RepID=A0A4P6JHQ9_KTERU|nr:LuxR C-terminal-related transcriptional regulator [Ktedonosporobacter rubrisoli]QBD74568.1 hypothetical protein EPA93_00590 [Ktedonosporobacter rubrisoli]